VQFLWRSTAAKLAAQAGHQVEAERLITEALRLGAASDSPLLLADLWTAQAEVLQASGAHEEAQNAATRARVLLTDKGDRSGIAELDRRLGLEPSWAEQTKSPLGLSV
jgi:hypothetical protein